MPDLHYFRGAVAALVLLATGASSAQTTSTADDAAAAVPPAAYTSAFDSYRPLPVKRVAPDQTWVAANAAVQSPGMAMGHDMGAMHGMPAQPAAPAKAAPAKTEPAPVMAPMMQHQHEGH